MSDQTFIIVPSPLMPAEIEQAVRYLQEQIAELQSDLAREKDMHATTRWELIGVRQMAASADAVNVELRAAADQAAKWIVFLVHIYRGYRIGHHSTTGCLTDALEAIAPDVLTEIRAGDDWSVWDRVYAARWGEEDSGDEGAKEGNPNGEGGSA